MKNVKRARQALAQDQAAWNSAMHKVHYMIDDETLACGIEFLMENVGCSTIADVKCKPCLTAYADMQHTAKEETMAKRIHFLLDDSDDTACGFEYADDEQVSDDIDEVTCKKCIKAAEELETLEEDEEEDDTEGKEEVSAPVPMHLKAIFTLAPRTLDKGDTKEVPCAWLYQGAASTGLNQPVRKVLVPEIQIERQINAYLHPTPYITFQEQTLEKYIKQGKVTETQHSGVALDPLKAAMKLSNNTNKEKAVMPAKKKAIVTPQVPALPQTTPLGILPDAKIRTLDAILAMPIVAPVSQEKPARVHIMQQAPVGVPEDMLRRVPVDSPEGRQNAAIAALKARMATPKTPLALPTEREEPALVAGLAPAMAAYSLAHDPVYVQLAQLVQGLRSKVESLEERLRVAEQAECVLQPAITMHDILSNVWDSIIGSLDMPDKAPVVPDAWGDMLSELPEPAKPKSTLQIFAGGNTAPKAARQGGSKADPAIIKAIQKAWRDKTHTQAQLAAKYGMDQKKVWFFANRAKSLI